MEGKARSSAPPCRASSSTFQAIARINDASHNRGNEVRGSLEGDYFTLILDLPHLLHDPVQRDQIDSRRKFSEFFFQFLVETPGDIVFFKAYPPDFQVREDAGQTLHNPVLNRLDLKTGGLPGCFFRVP